MIVKLLQIKEEFEAFLDWLKPQGIQRVLEIGTHQGGTALHFCELAPQLVISIDLPDGKSGGLPLADCVTRNQWISERYPQFRWVLGDSHDQRTLEGVRQFLGDAPLDLLFLDGDHSLDGVTQDVEMYGPLVKPGGVIAFHDINDTPGHRDAGCYVADLWNALTCEKREFNVHGVFGGIGVIHA